MPPSSASSAPGNSESYKAFREIDRREWEREHQRRRAAAVAAAENEVSLFRLDVEVLETEAAEALEVSRVAEDRAREAREYARQVEAEAARVKDCGSAQEVTDARVRADTADGVAAEREAAAEKARAEVGGLDRDLGEAREGLEAAEHSLRAAQEAAVAPLTGSAPISDATIWANAGFMQADEVWDQLADRDKHRVRQACGPRDMMSEEQFRAMVREVLGHGGRLLWAVV
jgi:hypothetical protein